MDGMTSIEKVRTLYRCYFCEDLHSDVQGMESFGKKMRICDGCKKVYDKIIKLAKEGVQ